MFRTRYLFLSMVAVLALSLPAYAARENLPAYSDGDFITLTGTVKSLAGDQFTLDYGNGQIRVDMDDWDWYSDATKRLKIGERVTVAGYVDKNFFSRKQIDAKTVYLPNRYAFYYFSGLNPVNPFYYDWYDMPPDGAWLSVAGTVKDVQGREFTLDTGLNEYRVDTKDMAYNPMDDDNYQNVDTGDRVRVSGTLDKKLFDTREVEANRIVTIYEDPGN